MRLYRSHAWTWIPAVLGLATSTKAQDVDCSLYLGESTIKSAGWGVFAGRSFEPGDQVGPSGIGIQILDPETFQDHGPIHQYLWRPWIAGGRHEAHNVRTFLPGVGSLANYHPIKFNVVEGGLHHEPQFDRKSDPQVGSNTEYHNFTFVATKRIEVGDEIFVGYNAFEKSDPQYVDLPEISDYERAENIIDDLHSYHTLHPELSQTQWIDILYRMKYEMMEESDKSSQLLPDTLEQLLDLVSNGVVSAGLIERNFEEIRKNGLCLDTIREGPSTIPKAGRGAFATKSLSNGSLIAPVPLLHIMNATALLSTNKSRSAQVLLNYCFGHEQSDMLLCPLSHAALINHNVDEANAELRWGKSSSNRLDNENFLLGLPDRLQMQSTELTSSGSRLMLEIVATKDLRPGDEILLNYGASWEAVYTEHVNTWSPIDDGFVSAFIKNKQQWAIVVDPLLPYECCLEPMPNEKRDDILYEDYLSYDNHNVEQWSDEMKLLFKNNPNVAWFPCEIIGAQESGSYIGNVYSKSLTVKRLIRKFHSIPREAIRFVDKPYESNQHLASSFRHYIPMSNTIFPFRWRRDYRAAIDFRLGVIDQGVVSKGLHAQILQDHEKKLRKAKCGLYYAPSNILGAGYSSYTAVPYEAGNITVGTQMSAIVIPFIKDVDVWDLREYVWGAKWHQAEYEVSHPYSGADIFGVSLANFHPALVNMRTTSAQFRPVLDSCKDPGAGAFSDYVGCAFTSQHVIQPGEELFVSYGENWFTSRKEFQEVPLRRHYKSANRMVASMISLMEVSEFGMNSSAAADFLDFVKCRIVNDHRTYIVMSQIESPAQLREVIEQNGTAQESVRPRSLEWLEKYGHCLDHVYYKDSTLPQAGKGAFSRRSLKRGSTIISTPLILTWGNDSMKIARSAGHPERINARLILENYQFKHPRADVYFLPITQVTAINHGSPRKGSKNPPNAKIEWGQWNRKSMYFLQRPLDDLRNVHGSMMVFDVVATRDISVDEEILIDYGEEWENAWKNHVKNFRSPCKGTMRYSSLAVYKMNFDKFNTDYHKWSNQHFTVCQNRWLKQDNNITFIYLAEESSEILVNGMLLPIKTSYKGISWNDEGFELIQDEPLRIPCKIVSSSLHLRVFDVVSFHPLQSVQEQKNVRQLHLHSRIPPDEVDFINKPFSSDMHLPGAFRHPIQIPDDIFPLHWTTVMD